MRARLRSILRWLSRLQFHWTLLAGLGVFIAVMGIINIEVELPRQLRGQLGVDGRIASCEFGSLGKGSSRFFIGIELESPQAPYLRANPSHHEREAWERLCERKATVTVYYHARQRLVGPVRFWIDTYVER